MSIQGFTASSGGINGSSFSAGTSRTWKTVYPFSSFNCSGRAARLYHSVRIW